MLFSKDHSPRRRLIFRAAIARFMAFVFLFWLLVPHPASALTVLEASSPAIMTAFNGGGAEPGEAADYDLTRHAGCSCHIGAPAQPFAPTLVCPDFEAGHITLADTQPRPGPASLPFKPPRA